MAGLTPIPDDPTDEEWETFWAQVRGLGKGDCETWIGTKFSQGYGAFWYRGKERRAHRLAYVWLYGEPGTVLDHHCDNKLCVLAHPKHVWPSTPRDNTLRGDGPTALNARKTKPDCGHDQQFTYIDPRGWRGCRECRRLAATKHKAKDPEKVNARRRARRKRVVYDERPCAHCGLPFTPLRSTGRMCTRQKCINERQRINRERRKG